MERGDVNAWLHRAMCTDRQMTTPLSDLHIFYESLTKHVEVSLQALCIHCYSHNALVEQQLSLMKTDGTAL